MKNLTGIGKIIHSKKNRKWDTHGLNPGFVTLRCVLHLHFTRINEQSKTKHHYNGMGKKRNLENKLKSKFKAWN